MVMYVMMYRITALFFLFFVSLTVWAAAVNAAPLANRYGSLPELIRTPFKTFSVPFEVLPGNSADPINEVELLVSTDQGKQWFSAGKTGTTSKQFPFKAENDGEYWFSFRTITLSGAVKQSSSSPQLRVLVQSQIPQPDGNIRTVIPSAEQPQLTAPAETPQRANNAEIQSLKQHKPEYGSPVSPPKPLRLDEAENKTGKKPAAEKAASSPQIAKSVNSAVKLPDKVSLSEKYRQMPLMSAATGEIIKADEQIVKKNESESVPVEELFSRLNQFYGGKLSEESITPLTAVKKQNTDSREQITDDRQQTADNGQQAEEKQQAGKITGISLNAAGTQPQIIVKWNSGEEIWGEAAKGIMVDVLRGSTPQGPWLPLVTSQKNSGEYWWFVSQDDLTPFHLMVRLRTLDGVVAADFTPSPIQINPKLLSPAPPH
ncbi:hypothetical protein FACS189427_09260 [Planctomycetales bacterium]|nr:hypothetical protein FACS189427_09260 [Planctomycetales bacterium]